ncbi:MAG TPA: AIPR family protein [Opitutales bacterium]|jgi:hypothetical protein|nr:AIPR family protein [Opitutales bacterium]
MKLKYYRVSVASDCIRKLADPQNDGHDAYYAYVSVKHLPADLPLDVNPRNQDTESRVARQIESGLIEEWSIFHLLNRGMTISALEVEYDNKTQTLTLGFPDGAEGYGVIDGGHTYAVIRKNLSSTFPGGDKPDFIEAYVRLEILVNIDSGLIVDLARARNTSAQVRDESLANLEGKFDWIKEALAKTTFHDRIAYRENEDLPLDVREVIALMTLFHPNFVKGDNPPIVAYSSKQRCLNMFKDEAMQEGYKRLRPILVDILRLYDFAQLNFAPLYKETGGISSIGSENGSSDAANSEKKKPKLGRLSEVKQVKAGFPLYYYGETAYYRFPDGWLYPVVGAHRAIASYKGANVGWKVDPIKFFERYGKSLVGITLEASKALGRNPNAVGKSKNHWIQLYGQVQGNFTELLGIDLERKVEL